VLRPKRISDIGFALLLLSSQKFIDYCTGASGGTRMPRVNWRDMAQYAVSWPGEDEIAEFNDFAAPVFERMNAAVVESKAIRFLRDSLISPLLSGELRLREAEERVVEAV
jgi:type I restriction enzyme S subunit